MSLVINLSQRFTIRFELLKNFDRLARGRRNFLFTWRGSKTARDEIMFLRWSCRIKRPDCSTWHESGGIFTITDNPIVSQRNREKEIRPRERRWKNSFIEIAIAKIWITGTFWGMRFQPFPVLIPLCEIGINISNVPRSERSFKILIHNHEYPKISARDFIFLLNRVHFFQNLNRKWSIRIRWKIASSRD